MVAKSLDDLWHYSSIVNDNVAVKPLNCELRTSGLTIPRQNTRTILPLADMVALDVSSFAVYTVYNV